MVGDLYKIVSEYDQEILKLNLDYTCDDISYEKSKRWKTVVPLFNSKTFVN